MAPARPANTLLPTTLVKELPNAAAASSAGPRCPTKTTLTKDTVLFRRKLVDTGTASRTNVWISALLFRQSPVRDWQPALSCSLQAIMERGDA